MDEQVARMSETKSGRSRPNAPSDMRGYSPECQSVLSAKCLTEHSSMSSEYPGGRNELSQSSPKRVLTAFRREWNHDGYRPHRMVCACALRNTAGEATVPAANCKNLRR